ncbi:anti-sigma factor antagonist [candidate division KSB1 bacterium]|nr:anti-sigma factor antagonist [candidate division KSB1 bacterium]
MKIQTERRDNVHIVTLEEKRLDSRIAAEFKNHLLEMINKEQKLKILIDLKAVDFIDSSGLGAIVSTLKNIAKKGELKIANPQTQVKDMFELTRLNLVFNIYDDLEAGLNNFKQ